MTRAAIMHSWDSPLVVTEVDLSPPGPGEVTVAIVASPICSVDLRTGSSTTALPLIPGHEGSGIVTRVGAGVTSVAEGDHVVLAGRPECGACFWCQRGEGYLCAAGQAAVDAGTLLDGTVRSHRGGQPLFRLGALGTFADEAVVPESAVIPIHPSLDLTVAAHFGCALLTGVGAATRVASIRPGDTVAVVAGAAAGMLPLHAIQGARLAGAGQVIAVGSLAPGRATGYGATDHVGRQGTAHGEDPLADVLDLTDGRGADVVIDASGEQAWIAVAVQMSRRGGQVVFAGIPTEEATLTLAVRHELVLGARRIAGCWQGSSFPREDIPVLLELYENGALRVDGSPDHALPLDRVNDGLRMVREGTADSAVIVTAL